MGDSRQVKGAITKCDNMQVTVISNPQVPNAQSCGIRGLWTSLVSDSMFIEGQWCSVACDYDIVVEENKWND